MGLKSEYTPTPWRVGKDGNDQPTVVADNGALVAVVAHECLAGREPEAARYARLFAASPAYHAAAEALAAWHAGEVGFGNVEDSDLDDNIWVHVPGGLLRQILSAHAAARGE